MSVVLIWLFRRARAETPGARPLLRRLGFLSLLGFACMAVGAVFVGLTLHHNKFTTGSHRSLVLPAVLAVGGWLVMTGAGAWVWYVQYSLRRLSQPSPWPAQSLGGLSTGGLPHGMAPAVRPDIRGGMPIGPAPGVPGSSGGMPTGPPAGIPGSSIGPPAGLPAGISGSSIGPPA